MKPYFIAVIMLVCVQPGIRAQSQPGGHASGQDWAYVNEPVNGISDEELAKKKFGENSAAFIAWDEKRRRQYQQRGTDFFNKFPDDPHFGEWFLKTTGEWQPHYWKDLQKDSEMASASRLKGISVVCSYDVAAENKWLFHYIFFRSLYLSNSSLKPEEHDDFLRNELINKMYALDAKIGRRVGNTEAAFHSNLSLINEYCKEAADMAIADKPETGPLGTALGVFGTHDSLIAKDLTAVQLLVKDSGYHNNLIESVKSFNKLKAVPVPLKLPSLRNGEGVIDLKNYRGKVVLVDFWNIHCGGCIAHMPKFEHIYEKFKGKGFVIVSVCATGNDGKENYQAEKAKALALEKKFGLTYPSAELHLDFTLDSAGNSPADNDPTWKYFGYPGGGAMYLLDQKGMYHTGDLSGRWLEFYIRKLLKLPLDDTGKE